MSEDNDNPQSWKRPTNSGPRITGLGGSSSSGSGPRRGGFATLSDLGGGGAGGPAMGGFGGPGGNDDDDGDDDGDKDEGESWFAGGERSGISVQNPGRPGNQAGNLVRDLLRRAAESGRAPPPEAATPGSRAFTGGGHTLGGEDVESTYIPDPNALDEEEEETAIRHLTFWRDGFSVDDGELMRYGDPANEAILAQIQSGRAPPHILNVTPGQPVELQVVKRLHEDYVPTPAAKRRDGGTFAGTGHRLGSPVPAVSATGSGSNMPGSFPAGSSSASRSPAPPSRGAESINTRFEVDQTLPTTSIQIRLADGTRMVCRMNLTHTVGDIRNFINASRPENLTRPYTINTTFPIKTLDDDSKSIEAAGLLNSVVVQRWV